MVEKLRMISSLQQHLNTTMLLKQLLICLLYLVSDHGSLATDTTTEYCADDTSSTTTYSTTTETTTTTETCASTESTQPPTTETASSTSCSDSGSSGNSGEFSAMYYATVKMVSFKLWTRSASAAVDLKLGHVAEACIDKEKEFKFVVHGWRDSGDADWIKKMREAYCQKGYYNFVIVDYSKIAKYDYPKAVSFAKVIGQIIAQMAYELNKNASVSVDNMHMIGHSLGAHICGFAGKVLLKKSLTLKRITGLDAAGPLYRGAGEADRLCKTDATFVDCIHTEGDNYGYYDQLGTADFYPNGGVSAQPGCIKLFGAIDHCSHKRSFWFFIESITSTGFEARQCDTIDDYKAKKCDCNPSAVMGENIDVKVACGVYMLTTNKGTPYGRCGKI